MISQSMKRYMQLGVLLAYAGFVSASQDPIMQEYKAYADVIKGDILPRLKIVKDRTEYTKGMLDKRLDKVESEIKKTLGRESSEAFWKRTGPMYDQWLDATVAYQKDPDNKKLFEKKKKLDANPDLDKRFKLSSLNHAKDVIETDINTQEYLLEKMNTRLQHPDEYLAAMNKKTFTEPGNIPLRDPIKYLVDSVEYYQTPIGDLGTDQMENWYDENHGYMGRRNLSQIPGIINEFDRSVQYAMEGVDEALEKEHMVSPDTLYKKLGLREVNKATVGNPPMFSPLERTVSQRVSAWLMPYYTRAASWLGTKFGGYTAVPMRRAVQSPTFKLKRPQYQPKRTAQDIAFGNWLMQRSK